MVVPARTLSTILVAARTGRLSASSARSWARRAAAGEDVSVLPLLTPGADRLSSAELTKLASDLVVILAAQAPAAGGARARVVAADDAITDDEADQLYPPRTESEVEDRRERIEAAAADARRVPEAELYDLVFQGAPYRDASRADAGGAPGHVQFTGQHIHTHPAYDGAGGQHTHMHPHASDASHDHDHPAG